ncbi:hypothetical protein ASL11_23755 [Paenibacillus sp. Soil750]|nr:hypothetical protein ASL11_23755 [Paenibacillus sp. Soil750]
MRLSCESIMEQLSNTGYIDAKLKGLSYDHTSHIVRLRFGDTTDNENDTTVIFEDCFSVNINNWLEDGERATKTR